MPEATRLTGTAGGVALCDELDRAERAVLGFDAVFHAPIVLVAGGGAIRRDPGSMVREATDPAPDSLSAA